MEEKFMYILATHRGSGSPEIHYICTSYNEIITIYYKYTILNDTYNDAERDYWFMYLYKFPLSVDFQEDGDSCSNVKLQKSSKYRIKFKTYGDLINEYRDITVNSILD